MERLTPRVSFDIFIDNYFTTFCLLSHLGVNNIRATGVLNKKMGTSSSKKQNKCDHFELPSAHKAKKQCNLCGWLERQQVGIQSFFWILPA